MEGETNVTSGRGTEVPQLHPLQNPVILAHLFKRCPPALLAQCRLVSKQWLALSLNSWRAASTLRLYYDYDPDPRAVKRPTLQQYLEFMDNPRNESMGKPHRNMILVSWRNDLRIQSFWNRVGRDLTGLALVNCEFRRVADLRQIIFRSCPNLKRLYLHNCTHLESALIEDFRELEYVKPTFGEQNNLRHFQVRMPDLRRNYGLPIHWLELFSHFPSLTSLKVSVNRESLFGSEETVTGEILQAVGIIKKRDKRKLCLERLDLDPPLKFEIGVVYVGDHDPHRDLVQLEELQLPLQSLEIEVNSNQTSRNIVLEGALHRHRDTLSRIAVSRGWNDGYSYSRLPFSWGFPCNVVLEKLEELRIHMLCTSMEFLKNVPKLTTLEFLEADGYSYSKEEETKLFSEPDATALVGVKLLHLTEFRMDYKLTSDDIVILAGLMPNVRKLTMSLNDALFAVVCQYWKDLKEMEVLGWDLTDKGVTGLDGEGNEPAPANINNLQDLESFKFWSQKLTDLSVFQGFLKLPSFKSLEVKGRIGVMPFGEAARKALQDRNIDFKGSFEYDECEDNYGNGDYENWADDDSD